MNDELKDYVETPNDKRRRTQQAKQTESNMSSENVINSPNSYQTNCLISDNTVPHCSTVYVTENNESSSSTIGYLANGCNTKRKSNGDSQNSVFNGNRAALYRNIYNSSSSEDEDEHCVYTYKGAEVGSDLPESFIHLGMNSQNREGISARSSPEMDFLEMDFDPGPSNGQDSDSDTIPLHRELSSNDHNSDMRSTSEDICRVKENESDNVKHDTYDENANCYTNKSLSDIETSVGGSLDLNAIDIVQESIRENPCCSKSLKSNDNEIDSTEYTIRPFKIFTQNYSDMSDEESSSTKSSVTNNCSNSLNNKFETDENTSDQKLSEDSDREEITYIPDAFDPIEPNENINENLFENLCDISLKTDINDFICYDDLLPLDPSYSITTVINVMKILNDSHCFSDEREKLTNLLRFKQMAENIPLVEYLFKRSVQNANEAELANFASIISENKLHSRFFCTYPNAHFDLVEWLYSWMRKGVVPVVTRNVQERGVLATKDIIRNQWRHNVVYKLESPYIHVLNPYEKVLEGILHSQLSQPSLIYIKRKCILQKWHSKVDLSLLMRANHNRWYNENVLGQVATVIRENDSDDNDTKYVCIPSNCRCGITLFVPSENLTLCREIDEAVELTTMLCY